MTASRIAHNALLMSKLLSAKKLFILCATFSGYSMGEDMEYDFRKLLFSRGEGAP